MFNSNFLEKLRNKTDRHKHWVAIFVSSIFIAIVFGFWSLSFIPQIQNDIATSKQEAFSLAAPLSNLQKGVAQAYESITTGYKQINDTFGGSQKYSAGTSSVPVGSTSVSQ
ncbi:MAG: hypothetical protein HQ402_03405 [Parcubacteria group bacterium]|nr:hypothetical protein [Parcubacteria group bacterium]